MQIFRNIKNTSDSLTVINHSTFLVQWLRIGIRLGSQLLTVLVVTFIIHKTFPSFSYTTISLPNTTVCMNSLDPSYIERSWFVNPFRYESVLAINDWYTYLIWFTDLHSVHLMKLSQCVLILLLLFQKVIVVSFPRFSLQYPNNPLFCLLNDNITSGLIEKPANNLKKGGPYDYLDTLATAILTLILSLFGLPWVSAMYIRSAYHLQISIF
ncbi:hypothetical protein JH06_3393 [Blastocystis sp. subtype 4]|uniref:hypothetical protein n=1 Tax=Blastocystis sp. subtype 4 TaxID=944170 RepID=UPI000711D824|nr:hypothetical protein JH06_3393 [Blastocystis sp. subtype 4]KNB43013.1 hypothetical protein JH06_3393 [Blastocystis sp. subtype 4]|eukprot:XP_014526456.1 hypothetical protein JH06_3393 [Blastocystis sp. subtype 4]